MKDAWDARDPRCNVLREFLGQTDTDTPPEGLDFRYHTTRVPDSSHEWHDHLSFVRAYVAIAGALDGVLSVLAGETLDAYLARGGKLYKIDGTGELGVSTQDVINGLNENVAYQSGGVAKWAADHDWSPTMGHRDMQEYIWEATYYNVPDILKIVTAMQQKIIEMDGKLDRILSALSTGGSGTTGGALVVTLSGTATPAPQP
jgi:hypothetical protein